jgi:predicted O-methyltransferase YrrM
MEISRKQDLTEWNALETRLAALVRDTIDAQTRWNSLEEMRTRNELPVLLNMLNYKTMIEIGVQKGFYAMNVLSQWQNFDHYWGIDLWQQQNNYLDSTNVNDTEQLSLYNYTYKTLTDRFGKDRITLLRNYSTHALTYFKNESTDFIYVDARHDYCGCYEDINNYYPILRCGGLMAGHDFQFDSHPENHDWGVCANGSRIEGSVKRAVMHFARENSIDRVYRTGEKFFPSWYFFKKCS